jgi:tRNA/tmRNA/rRNA uracil-C5-methylase (TrmA/RlmC/RlmD family)
MASLSNKFEKKKKPSSKLEWFFEDYKIKKNSKLQADKEALYSITQSKIAQQISNNIKRKFPGITCNSTISDLTACVGGNTINFARNFKHVNSIELDEAKFQMLINNADAIGVNNINFIHGDSTLIVKDLEHDVVFFDPPWGGTDYKNNKTMKLQLSDRFIEDIIIKDIMDTTNYIVVKVPMNFNMANFHTKLKKYFHIETEFVRNKMIIIYLIKINK